MQIVFQIATVLLLLGSGWLARRRGWLSDTGTRELAHVLLSLVVPCLIVTSLARRSANDVLANAHLPLLTLGFCMMGLGIGALAVRLLPAMPDATRRSFLFQSLVNNYLFLPLPIVLFRYGEPGVAMLLLASLGFEVAIWTVGVALYVPGRSWTKRFKDMVTPAFAALVGSSVWVLLRDGIPGLSAMAEAPPQAVKFASDLAMNVCDKIAQATIPLSMIVAGSRIAGLHPSHLVDYRVGALAAIRLLAVPLAFAGALSFLPVGPDARGVLLVVSSMPTAITAVLFSDRYGGDTDFVAGGLIFTHLLSLISVPLLLSVLG